MSDANVKVRFTGLLAKALGLGAGQTSDFQLADPATYRSLLTAIGARHGDEFPPNTWDAASDGFSDHVQLLQDGERLIEPETPIQDGAEIVVLVGIAGG